MQVNDEHVGIGAPADGVSVAPTPRLESRVRSESGESTMWAHPPLAATGRAELFVRVRAATRQETDFTQPLR